VVEYLVRTNFIHMDAADGLKGLGDTLATLRRELGLDAPATSQSPVSYAASSSAVSQPRHAARTPGDDHVDVDAALSQLLPHDNHMRRTDLRSPSSAQSTAHRSWTPAQSAPIARMSTLPTLTVASPGRPLETEAMEAMETMSELLAQAEVREQSARGSLSKVQKEAQHLNAQLSRLHEDASTRERQLTDKLDASTRRVDDLAMQLDRSHASIRDMQLAHDEQLHQTHRLQSELHMAHERLRSAERS
jgi:hypothetical protein